MKSKSSVSALVLFCVACHGSASSPADTTLGHDASAPVPDAGGAANGQSDAGPPGTDAALQTDGSDVGIGTNLPPTVPPNTPPTATTTATNYAVTQLFLGDTANGDSTFAPSSVGWKAIGYDLDGRNTVSGTATDVCRPPTGLPVMVDGLGGIDNAFGAKIVPIVNTIFTGPSKQVSTAYIGAGHFTEMFDIRGIDPLATTGSASGLSTSIFVGGDVSFAGTPQWGATTNWPVRAEWLSGSPGSVTSGYVLPAGGMVSGLFTSGPGADMPVDIGLMMLSLHRAVVTFQLAPDGSAMNGVIAGIVSANDLKASLVQMIEVGGGMSLSVCQALPTLLASVDKASDVMLDGTTGVGQSCDAVSVGIGFTAKAIAQPSQIAPAVDAGTSPCPDGG